jgi:hypothetical protein
LTTMRTSTLTLVLVSLLALAICQEFPSSSQTWENQQLNDTIINITGTDLPKYPTGHVELSIHISEGSGMMYYGVGHLKNNFSISGSSITYLAVTPFCALDEVVQGTDYYVSLESTVDLRYKVMLTQYSSELPNNETIAVNDDPNIFTNTPYWIAAGDKDRSKTITITVNSGVSLDGYMGMAIVQARQRCSAESSQNQTFSVPANSTTWTFTAQFDAGYENYTVNFKPAEKVRVFSTFLVNSSVKLGPKSGLGNWIFLIIGGAAAVLIVAVIGIVLYVRSRRGYTKIQDSY